MEKFKNLGLSYNSIKTLEKKGFEEPTEIQEKAIPYLLNNNKDLIVQAETGTGKTAVFGLLFVEKIVISEYERNPQALVLTPTRELAVQVTEEISSLKGESGLRIASIYGGQSLEMQKKLLKKGLDVIVGTPGRILDHLKNKVLKLGSIKYLVLDEADEMLNMGFIDDVEEILRQVNKDKQFLLFSATMPKRITDLVKKYMSSNNIIQAKKGKLTENLIDQIYFEVNERDKFEALCRIIDIEPSFYGIIFTRTKIKADELSKKLSDRGYDAEGLHGDIPQNQRERILSKFRNKLINILVATDVAARGIDVSNLTHVINYSLPQDPESYIHRIGRTGRAGREGTAITFVTPEEYRQLSFIKKSVKADIRKERIPEVSEIIEIKKARIVTEIESIITSGDLESFNELAVSISGKFGKDEIIAALLKYSFSDELDISGYSDIGSVKSKKDDKENIAGKTRLFMTLGKYDDMTPKKLVVFIEEMSGVKERFISNVEIFNAYSFITVPFKEAEIILKFFSKEKSKSNIVVEKAGDRKKRKR